MVSSDQKLRRWKRTLGYTVSSGDYDLLLKEQEGVCAICGSPPVLVRNQHSRYRASLQLDHDHGSGLVRGLLCPTCNRLLGQYENQQPKYEDYLMNQIDRPSRDLMLMKIAEVNAERSTCLRAKVGAVISRGARVISSGYVGAPSGLPQCDEVGCDPGFEGGCRRTTHAEVNAITWAAREGIATLGCVLTTTYSPCKPCCKAIINSGIRRVVYRDTYRDVTGLVLLKSSGVEVVQIGI